MSGEGARQWPLQVAWRNEYGTEDGRGAGTVQARGESLLGEAEGGGRCPLIPTAPKERVIGRPFEPGQSGNPNGRPKGARNKLGEDFIQAL
jgi:hypothetical protein